MAKLSTDELLDKAAAEKAKEALEGAGATVTLK